MEKIKNLLVIEGLSLFFSWVFGLAIDETIQKSIIQYPDSYKLYQLIQKILHIDKVIAPIFIFLWIIGNAIYFFNKFKNYFLVLLTPFNAPEQI